jgi:hypothetical protein
MPQVHMATYRHRRHNARAWLTATLNTPIASQHCLHMCPASRLSQHHLLPAIT